MPRDSFSPDVAEPKFSVKQVVLYVGLAVIGTMLVTTWWINQYLYAANFEPTQLSMTEQQELNMKMAQLQEASEFRPVPSHPANSSPQDSMEPEPYRENDQSREIHLTEREVNALIAQDPEAAKHVAVDLAEDLVSVKMLVPIQDEIPLLGGKTLKVNIGVHLSYANGKPVVAMKGISLGGIPLPSAWWGEIKNKNLVEEFGGSGGFWDQFSKGVKDLHFQEGSLRVTLQE